jgi:hypothetical protein
MYRLSYYHNGNDNNNKWNHETAVAVKTFSNEEEAYEWVKDNPQYTPVKLGVWDEAIDCYSTIKVF